MTATTMAMMEMTHGKQKCWMVTPIPTNKLRKPQEQMEQRKIPGVNDTKEETPGMGGVGETPGVDDYAPKTKYESDEAEVKENGRNYTATKLVPAKIDYAY